jgi:hypothetical protein
MTLACDRVPGPVVTRSGGHDREAGLCGARIRERCLDGAPRASGFGDRAPSTHARVPRLFSRHAMWDPTRLAHARFARVADLVSRFAGASDWPAIASLNACFAGELAIAGVRRVEAGKTKPALAADGTIDASSLYEVRIVERGEIPTRPRNLHDLLNALVWAAFPRAKLALTRRLAAIQRARAAGRATLPPARSREHDRLAMVDEGGLVCVAGSAPWIFGHALYEHAYAGELAVRGAAIDLDVDVAGLDPIAARATIDRALAATDLAGAVREGPGISID